MVAALRAAGCVWAEDEAEVLLGSAGPGRSLADLLARRVAGEPLEVVVGWAAFAGLRVGTAPGVFVPRRRSELLVDLALRALRSTSDESVVVDLGCGTGALGMAVLAAHPVAELWAVDIDPVAVACAAANLASLPAGRRARVGCGDLWAPLPPRLRGGVDVILANAPYVPSAAVSTMPSEAREHERLAALDGGPDGLDVQRRVLAGAASWLAPGGVVLVETSPAQVAGTSAAARRGALRPSTHRDAALAACVVSAARDSAPDQSRRPSGPKK